jgi:hypothetical protein
MVRVVILAGILAASIHAANAQDTFGNSEAGRVYLARCVRLAMR